jgi:Xaa-Pro aminopeptidase
VVSSIRFMDRIHAKRLRALRRRLEEAGVEALLLTQPANWFYLSGFTGEAGAFLVGLHAIALVTDGRFAAQAASEVRGAQIVTHQGSVFESVVVWCGQQSINRVGFDPAHLTISQLDALRRSAGAGVAWVPLSGAVEGLRSAKDASEIAQMRRVALLGSEVMEHILKALKPGVRELEVAAEAEYQMRMKGASGPAFETIVASGPRSAFPHARPTAKRLKKNELVVLDLGAILGGYCSDLTRTVFLGRAPVEIRRWFLAVREAQAAALEAARVGVVCGDVDAAARGVLAGRGLEKYFIHSTGHGLGLEVHEMPRLARGQKETLQHGHVVTIEPGVYVEGVGGIRIEDDVAILAHGNEVLTRVPRDVVEL